MLHSNAMTTETPMLAPARIRGKASILLERAARFLFYAGALGWGGVSFATLLVRFAWMISLAQLLKRAIFLVGIDSRPIYYGVQLLPSLIALLLLVAGWQRYRALRFPASACWLFLFAVIALFSTVLYSPDVPLLARAAAANDHILPLSLLLVGVAVPLESALFLRVARALVISALLTVAYALVQFFGGPTFLDVAWARAAAPYSIQAQKTQAFLLGEAGWRGYSYFADPLTWGLFLLAALTALLAGRWLQPQLRCFRWPGSLAFLVGLFLCLTRTPWVGLLTMGMTYLLVRRRISRQPLLLYFIILAGFPLVILTGTYLYQEVFPSMTMSGNAILDRYETVGTIEARLGAWQGLTTAVSRHPWLGTGFGYSDYYNGRLTDLTDNVDLGGHNFAVELANYTGVPGLLVFLAFLWCLLREGTRVINSAHSVNYARAAGWLLVFIIGSVMTGYLNGGNFMNPFFFFFGGVLAGESARLKFRRKQCP